MCAAKNFSMFLAKYAMFLVKFALPFSKMDSDNLLPHYQEHDEIKKKIYRKEKNIIYISSRCI